VVSNRATSNPFRFSNALNSAIAGFKNGRVKVAVGVAKGKKEYDKRETIKRRETERETRAAVKARR